jgi:hypothetical protein
VTEYGDTGGRVQRVQLDGRRWVEVDRSAVDGLEKGTTIQKQPWSTTLDTSDGPRALGLSTEVWLYLGLAILLPATVWWAARPPG